MKLSEATYKAESTDNPISPNIFCADPFRLQPCINPSGEHPQFPVGNSFPRFIYDSLPVRQAPGGLKAPSCRKHFQEILYHMYRSPNMRF